MSTDRTFLEILQVWVSRTGLLGSWAVWGGLGAALLLVALYWRLGGTLGELQTKMSESSEAATSKESVTAMFRGGLARTGVYEGPGPGTPPVEAKWVFDTEGTVASPVAADSTVYVGSKDDNVYAIDAKTGKEEWRFTTGGTYPTRQMFSSPAVAGGTVYVGGDDNVYAIDAETGKGKWRFKTRGNVYSSPAVAGGTVYVGGDFGYVYALSAETGREKWQFAFRGGTKSSPAVVGGSVYFGSGPGIVYAISTETDRHQWVFKAGDGGGSSPAVVGGTVYIGSSNEKVYALH